MKSFLKGYFCKKFFISVGLCFVMAAGTAGCSSAGALGKAVETPVPATQVPVPATQIPATEVPVTEIPATEVPATEIPVTEAPATEVPATEVPVIEIAQAEVSTPEPVVQPEIMEQPQDEDFEENPDNRIINGNFRDGINNWSVVTEGVTAEIYTDAAGQGVIDVKAPVSADSIVQLIRGDMSLHKGNKYRLTFECVSNEELKGLISIRKTDEPETVYFEREIVISPKSRIYSFEFSMKDESDYACSLVLNPNEQRGSVSVPPANGFTVSVDNFEMLLLEGREPGDVAEAPKIHVDQIGYEHNEKKYAIIVSDDPLFEIWDVESERPVFNGRASEPIKSYASDEFVRIADFTSLYSNGRYYIKNSEGRSYEFSIFAGLYSELKDSTLKMFDYQRCGLEAAGSGWPLDLCHTQWAYVYGTDEMLDVSGGFHAAGDYNRYVVPTAKALADILITYENGWTKDAKALETARYGLEWMLKMQDKQTGGVYHKVTLEYHDVGDMPGLDSHRLYVSPVSSAATADFAAVMAMASRIYQDDLSKTALKAAENAWAWLTANPDSEAFKNPEGITGEEYSDDNDRDERYWASCELYRTTGEPAYHEYLQNSVAYQGFGWADVGYYGSIAYLNTPYDLVNRETFLRTEASVYAGAKSVLQAHNEDPYLISIGREYPVGSNMSVANNAMILVFGYNITKESEYLQAVREHLHYLFGRNALSQSFITGYGSRSPQYPYHLLSISEGYPLTGMLVGGPSGKPIDDVNSGGQTPPAKAYEDSAEGVYVNEPAIFFNSPLYTVFSYLNKLSS